ncbi:MAG TPA: PQQ-binding-like beta-propeller repeat protein [Vicinamibacterales bacterium]|nr:PQQ-binding-like beta-propeller repeat protein [Vicinamibacterales bacterium]
MYPISRRAMLQALVAQPILSSFAQAQTRLVTKPKPLPAGAVTHDWTSFLGPTHNAVSTETKLSRTLPPPLVWEFPKGTSYSSPAVANGRLMFIHRVRDEEVVECMDAETGAGKWQFKYGTVFEDRYGYNNGPRASPVIDGTRVYTMGAEGKLHCFDIASGMVLWKRDLRADYKVPQDFFGTASTPLVEGRVLIVNVGAPGGPCVAAFDTGSGKEVWRAGTEWGPSYASPIPAVVHGRRRVFVFAGGESEPPTGGLMSIDPANGKVDFSFPWRSRSYESVNASCPVIFDNKVFISASYRTGGALIEIRPDFTHRVVWTTQEFGLHFNTPIYRDGYLYGFDGRNEPDASLACLDVASGKVVWREMPEWSDTLNGRPQDVSTYRGSLLAVDGAFLCLGELGHLLWLELTPKGYKQISRAWLFPARESWSLPVLSRGLLYVVQNTRDVTRVNGPRLLCYDLRGA